MPPEIEFRIRPGNRGDQRADSRAEAGPLRIVLMGDFSGRRLEGAASPEPAREKKRRLTPIDIDNFGRIMARIAPRLRLPLAGAAEAALDLSFGSLDDFHPDSLFRRLDVFRTLESAKNRLLEGPSEREQAAAPGGGAGTTEQAAAAESDAATLQRLLGERAGGPPPAVGRPGPPYLDLGPFLRNIVAPYVVPGPRPREEVVRQLLDRAFEVQMRAILHHPAFQALEAAWRSAHRLVSRLEVGPDLELCLLDATLPDLAEDLQAAGGEASRWPLFRSLIEDGTGGPEAPRWTLIAADYGFGPKPEDLALLSGFAALGPLVPCTLLAGADPSLLGCRSLSEDPDPASWQAHPNLTDPWDGLRRHPAAPHVGLALPRVLLRQPYGRRSDPIEAFEFEEMDASPEHETYLWGSPAFACAEMIGRGFCDLGWETEPGDCLVLEDLPAYVPRGPDEGPMQACAETYLGDRAAEAILGRGLMPIVSLRNRNAARLVRFQSMADPPAPLAGPWGPGIRPGGSRHP